MAAQVVTGETRAEFMAGKMARGNAAEKPAEVKTEVKSEPKPGENGSGNGAAEVKAEVKTEKVEPDQKPAKSSIDERMAELTARRKDAEKRAEAAERERDELRREREEARKGKNAKPKPEDFSDPVKYGEAYGEWLAEDRIKQREEKDRNDAERARQAKLTEDWNKRYKKAAKEIEDFEEVIMAEPLSLQPAVVNAMFESDVGPQLHYFFSKDREETEKINAMSAASAVRYLGRIEARIEAEQSARQKASNIEVVPAKPIKRTPEAPEPIKPISSSSNPGTGGVLDADGNVTGSYADYKAARRAGKIK